MKTAEETAETQRMAAAQRQLRIRLKTRMTSRSTRGCVALIFATPSGSMACGRCRSTATGSSTAGRSPGLRARIAAFRLTSQPELHRLISGLYTEPRQAQLRCRLQDSAGQRESVV